MKSFEIVETDELHLDFSATRHRSPYVDAIRELEQAEDGSALCFAAGQGRQPLRNAAKKIGVKLLFAESDGRLFVKIDRPKRKVALPAGSVEQQIVTSLSGGPLKKGDLRAKLQLSDQQAAELPRTLQNLATEGVIRLQADSRWKLVAQPD